jgi:hypothetical protein
MALRRSRPPKSGVDRFAATLRRSARAMRPDKVAARFFSGGRYQSFGAIAKAPFKAKTVGTPKTMRKQHQQWTKQRSKQRAADRKAAAAAKRTQVRAAQKTAATAARGQRAARAAAGRPINPRTGKPITWREAQAGIRQAERELKRIEDGLAGKKPATRRPRAKAAPRPQTPLSRAIADVQKTKKPVAPKKKPAAKKTARKSTSRRVIPIPPILAGAAPLPLARPGRNLRGVVMAATCECQGTGRIPVYGPGPERPLSGTTSCPEHGRAGSGRGAKRLTTKRAIRDSGLLGLGAWLQGRRTKKRGNSDARQSKAWHRAHSEHRLAGPRLECEWCEGGIKERRLTKHLRAEHIAAAIEAAEEGKVPSKRKLEAAARRAYPYELCSRCKGLGVVPTSVELLQDGTQPVAEWRAGAGLRKQHRLTPRERATGKRDPRVAKRRTRRRSS